MGGFGFGRCLPFTFEKRRGPMDVLRSFFIIQTVVLILAEVDSNKRPADHFKDRAGSDQIGSYDAGTRKTERRVGRFVFVHGSRGFQ
jgi:hypothetical protein